MKKNKQIIKTRMYSNLRKTIYYYNDGSKETRYWDSIDTFCNKLGI